jgi:hypothetical protein
MALSIGDILAKMHPLTTTLYRSALRSG